MDAIRQAIRLQPFTSYIVLTYTWSWAWWLALVLDPKEADRGWADTLSNEKDLLILTFVGSFGAVVSAVVINAASSPDYPSENSTYKLLVKKTRKHRPFRWFIWVALLPVLIAVLTIAASFPRYLSKGLLADLVYRQSLQQVLVASAYGAVASILEEYGWRRFALPCLLKRESLFKSSMIIGLAWGTIHLPFYYHNVGRAWGQWFWPCFLFLGPLTFTGHSLMLTGLHISGEKSFLAAVLYHFSIRLTSMLAFPAVDGLQALQVVGVQALICFTVVLPVVLFQGGEHYWKQNPKVLTKEA